jgi:hypothetical protein
MPAYSFKERFVPMVKDGSKSHTIRARRKKGFAKPGDTLYLYYGMRTKFCTKLREEICTDVKTIVIFHNASVIVFPNYLVPLEFAEVEKILLLDADPPVTILKNFQCSMLNNEEKSMLAWRDGFRYEPTGIKNIGNFELMIRFWNQTHQLPFIGDIIYWNPTPLLED